MKIGILGTRGIPNYYGGFEECAQQLGSRLVQKGHQVTVYSSHRHPYSEKDFQGMEIIHKYDPEHRIGTAGQFIYDLNCVIDARWRKFDVLLLLGYTSSSLWQKILPTGPVILNNMDGLEWKRSKYSPRVKSFLKIAEKWAANGSDLLIADAREIENYLSERYQQSTVYIPYGAKIFNDPDPEVTRRYGVEPGQYNLVMARLEPENNIETILKGVLESQSEKVTLVVGNHETTYGQQLKNQFRDSRIRFVKGAYAKKKADNLRYFSHIYFHGHSVGGTNPSLLEAMACSCLICAHDNPFNREVLGEDANLFIDSTDVANCLDILERNPLQQKKIEKNLEKVEIRYNWEVVAEQYELAMQQAVIQKQRT